MKSRSASKIKLTSYDNLIGGTVSKDDIQEIPIGQRIILFMLTMMTR